MADFTTAAVPLDSPTADAGSPAAPVAGSAGEAIAAVVSQKPSASESEASKEARHAQNRAKAIKALAGSVVKGNTAPAADSAPAPSEPNDGNQDNPDAEPAAEAKIDAELKREPKESDIRASLANKEHALKRREARLERDFAQAQAATRDAQQLAESLKPWQTFVDELKQNPGKALGGLAERTGIPKRQLAEAMTKAELSEKRDPITEVEALRLELQQMKQEALDHAKRAEEGQRFQSARANHIRNIVAGLQDEAAAEDFPFAAALDEKTLEREVARAVDSCYQHMPNAGYADVVRLIDQHYRDQAAEFSGNPKLMARIASHSGTDPRNRDRTGTDPQNRGTSPTLGGGANRSTKAKASTLSNRDAAASAASGPQTREQRRALAAAAIKEGMYGAKS